MLTIDMDFLVRTLEESIRINSIIPNEEAYAAFLADTIRSIGIEPEWEQVAPGRPNVYASADLGPSDRFILLTGHTDTVDIADGWSTDPFDPVVKDGRMYGLGSFDMKSGLICGLAAFKALVDDPSLHGKLGRVGFAATVDEEGYGAGATALLDTEYAQAHAALLGEPFPGLNHEGVLPLGITGKVLYRLIVQGRQAHGFHPERGINAVEDAAKIIAALEQLPIASHPDYGSGNYSTLKIDGGYQEYAISVPQRCEVIITRLIIPGESKEKALQDMEQLVDSLQLDSSVTIETPPPYYDPYSIDLNTDFVQHFTSAYKRNTHHEAQFGFVRGITDANIYVPAGIPTINFGPTGAGAHEAGEYVNVAALEPCAQIFAETARDYLMG